MAEPVEGPAIVAADIEKAPDSHDQSSSAAEEAENTHNPERTLAQSSEAIKKVEVEKVIVLSFRSLQLQRIAELQDELLSLAVGPASQQTPGKDLIDKALSDYAEALRNYETLSQHAQSDIPNGARPLGILGMQLEGLENKKDIVWKSKSFFANLFVRLVAFYYGRHAGVSDKSWSNIHNALRASLPGSPTSMFMKYMEETAGDLGFRELDQKGRERRFQENAFTQRIIMAMFGGAALIGPMLIMTLHPSKNTSLITVSVATFVFALVLAFIARDSAGKDVLGATAAYAAVLVVFVGTSIAPTS